MADASDDRASRRKSSSSTASAPASVKSGLSFSLNLTPTYLPASGGRTSACSSAHPSPNGSITLEAATPRSMKQSVSADVISPLNSRSTEPTSSPFFADWQLQSPTPPDALDDQLGSEDEEGTDAGPNGLEPHTTPSRRYSLTSTAASASSVAALYASSSSPLFASPPSTMHDAGLARLSPMRPQEPHLQLAASDWQSPPHQLQDRFRDLHTASPAPPPLSPLPVSAEPPFAPRLGNLVTPVMTPRNSQPPATLAYFRSLSPLLAQDAASLPRSPLTASPDTRLQEAPTIHALLDARGHLPLPGHTPDKLESTISDPQQASLRSSFGQATTRSESVDSISSVINDCGGFDTVTSADAQAMAEVSAEPPMYGGSAVIHPMSAPPLQPLPSALDRALPVLPATQVSDPPLISSLRRPDLMQIAGENASSTSSSAAFDRPISPFSPSQPVFPEGARRVASSSQKPGYMARSDSPLATEQDLINFESDPESSPAPYGTLESGEDLTYRLQPHAGDAIYFSQHHPQSRNLGDGSDAESVSSNEADQEEEEDFEAHMLYATLSKSQSPFVRKAWEGSKVVLVPPTYTLPSSFTADAHQYDASTSMSQPRDWERFTAAHALRQQAGSPDLFVGCEKTFGGKRLHAKLDAIKGQVEISLREAEDEGMIPRLGLANVDEFGASLVPQSQPLSRNAISMGGHASTSSSSTQTPPPNLMLSSASSIGSSNFPTTPPLSPESQQHAHTRSSSIAAVSSTRMTQGVAFPSVEPIFKYDKSPLSPTRRVNIVREKPVYRKRRVSIANSSSAPSTLPSPPPLSRNETPSSISAVAGIPAANVQPPQVNVQQLGDRLSRLSTASTQSISSLASTQGKTVKKRDSKVRLRVPKWLGGRKDAGQPASSTMMITESAPSSPAVAQSKGHLAVAAAEEQLVIERVRVIKVDSYIIEWPGQEMLLSPRHDLRRSLPLSSAASSQSHAARMYRKASQPLPVDRTLREGPLPDASILYRPDSSVGCSEESGSMPPGQPSRLASRHNSNASRASRRSSNALKVKQVLIAPSSQLVMRDFSSDIAYLLDPPTSIEHFAGLFEQALKLIIRCCKDYAERFQYIRGLEQEAVRRLRTDILEQVWQYVAHEQSISVIHQHLFEIFENVIMAFSHDYVFTRTIKPMFADHEAQFSQIVDVYRSHTVTMSDFGISNSGYAEASFVPVLDILGELCGTGGGRRELWEKMTPQAYKRLVQLISQTTDSASTVIALLEAKTPVDTVAQLRKSIDELIRVTSAGNVGGENRYGLVTDDLIPLLSWSVMKANAKGLPSLLFYARHFRLTDISQAESDWTIVQFEAAIAYILTDPLQLWRNSASASPALDSAPMSPTAPILLRHNSDDSYTLSSRSRRTSVQSLPPESSRDKSRSPTSNTHRASHHKRTLSSVPSTRIVSYQASGRPSSVVSTVTTEENEDNAAMGPPAPPKRPGTSSSNGRNSIISSGSRGESEGTAAVTHGQRLSDSHRQQLHRPTPVRPVSRAYHNSHDSTGLAASQPTRIVLGRSQTTPYSAVARPSSYLAHKASVDLHRSGSDPSRRASNGDWWGPLRYGRGIAPASPPPGSETTVSSRPESPASPALRTMEKQGSARSSFDLERSTSDIGWVEWGRRRLSSMTSSTSLVDSAEGGRSVADQIAEKIAASAARSVAAPPTKGRGRRNSESAAGSTSIPAQFEDANLETQTEQAPATLAEQLSRPAATQQRSLHRAGSRPRSTLSLSSTSSLDTESSLSRSVNASSSPMAGHPQFRTSISGLPSSYGSHSSNLSRSRRFRRELLSANLGPTMALPQLHLDTASASSASSLTSSICSAPTTGPSHRLSSLGPDNLPLSASSGGASLAFPSSYSMSHSTSRLGTTPFSPIQEIAPGHMSNSNSPDQLGSTYISAVPPEGIDSVPPTPTARAPGRTVA